MTTEQQLDEKQTKETQTQNRLQERIKAAMDLAISDGGFVPDQVECHGLRAFRKAMVELRRQHPNPPEK